MYQNDFSVRVPEGNETPGGYVELPHGTQYTLVLRNSHGVRCDARVEIDGKDVGVFRIAPRNSIKLERPAHDESRFTFFKSGSQEASQSAEWQTAQTDKGLIRVTFTPEEEYRPPTRTLELASAASYPTAKGLRTLSASRSAGVTGLTGHSDQKFVNVGTLNYDYSKQTVIHLRLICVDSPTVRPLTSYSTPVPPPVW